MFALANEFTMIILTVAVVVVVVVVAVESTNIPLLSCHIVKISTAF